MEKEKPKQVSLELARLLTLIEKYGFSLAFLFFAGTTVQVLMTEATLEHAVHPEIKTVWDLGPVFIIQQVLLIAFNGFIGIGLLRNSTPTQYPERYTEVFFPMLGTFLALLVNIREYVPAAFTAYLLPGGWREMVSFIAIAISILGYSVSIWGIVSLGRSFGALVAVRKVVLVGPYRLVRHPIYCGYLFETTGLVLGTFSVFSIVWVALALGVQIYRAILEERRLAESSSEYREYQRKVGFLLPKIGLRP